MKETPDIKTAIKALEKKKAETGTLPDNVKSKLTELIDEETRPEVNETLETTHCERVKLILKKEEYTSGEIAKLLKIPNRTIRRYLEIGKITGNQHPITKTWIVTRDDLIEFLKPYEESYEIIIPSTDKSD